MISSLLLSPTSSFWHLPSKKSPESNYWFSFASLDTLLITCPLMSYTAAAKYIKKSKSFVTKWVERHKANKKHPVKVHVWECFSQRGFGCLELLNENLNAQKMLQIYERGPLRSATKMFGTDTVDWILEEITLINNFGLAITVPRCESNRKCLDYFKEEACGKTCVHPETALAKNQEDMARITNGLRCKNKWKACRTGARPFWTTMGTGLFIR